VQCRSARSCGGRDHFELHNLVLGPVDVVMAVAGIGRRPKLWWFGAGRVFDLLGGCRRYAHAKNARPRQCRKSPQYAAALPADPLHRLLPSARRPHPRIQVGFGTKMALLGFLGNSQPAGSGKCDRWGGTPEDRLGAGGPTAYMFGHVDGRASPGKTTTAARLRPGSERAPDIVTPPGRGSLMLSSRHQGLGCRHFIVKDVAHARTEYALSRAFGLPAFVPVGRPAPVGRARSLAISAYVPQIALLALAPPVAP
jgi:hypothetical protein